MFAFNAVFSKTCASIFTMGMFSPGFIFMAFQLSTDFSANPKAMLGSVSLAHLHWYIAGAVSAVGVVALVVMLNHPLSKRLLAATDRKLQADYAQRLRDAENLAIAGGSGRRVGPGSKGAADEASPTIVLRTISICVASIFTSIFAIVSITTYFTKIPSSGMVGHASLPVVLFYVKNSSDFLGRVLTLAPLCITSQRSLGIVVFVRFLLVPVFFIYATTDFMSNDLLLLILVGVSGVTAGYINTSCFVVAGSYMKSPTQKKTGAGVMNLTMQLSLVVSILFGAILSFTVPTTLPGAAAVNATAGGR